MGEMLSEIPKASHGTGSNQYERKSAENHTDVKFSKPKADILEEIGLNRMTANRFEQMAAHPEIVEQAIADIQSGLFIEFHPIRHKQVIPAR